MASTPREYPAEAVELPPSLIPLVQGCEWGRSTVGESGDAVYRLHRADHGADLYLKHAKAACAVDLAGEMVRLRWLGAWVTVPAVRHFSASPDEAWLLMTALPGRTAYEELASRPDDRGAIISGLAAYLRRLHAIPRDSCPFNSDHRLRLVEARWRLDHGLVDEGGFDTAHCGWTAHQVWDAMNDLMPLATDQVVTHGDFSLDNIIVADGVAVGCIDVGRAGLADRYQDLAIIWNSLTDFGPKVQHQFLSGYGLDELDIRKVAFHLMLDEMF